MRKGAHAVAVKLAALGPQSELYEPLKKVGAMAHGKELSVQIAELETNASKNEAQTAGAQTTTAPPPI